jgi:hypothetical protein
MIYISAATAANQERDMKSKSTFRGVLYFMAGVAVTLAVMFGFLGGQDAQADQYSCIRTDLNARGMSGNVPDPQFTITYEIPSCLLSNGYTVEKVWMRGGEVAVQYKKN